jgi:hypothetical protein
MYAWSYPEKKRVAFVYSHIKRTRERAYTMQEVSEMVNRDRDTLQRYMAEGHIARPAMTYTLDGTFRPSKYLWREEEIFALHDYMLTVHYGKPRNDGLVTPLAMPNRQELRAMLRHETVYYVKNSEGEVVKAFREEVW